MRTIKITIAIILLCLALCFADSTFAQTVPKPKCSAQTLKKTQCTRYAKTKGLCTQHYNIATHATGHSLPKQQ